MIVNESNINCVPFGAVSFIVTVPSFSPLLVAVIVYVNVSPTFTSFSSTTLSKVITAVFVSFVGLSFSVSFTTAMFDTFPSIFSVTSTVNLTIACFPCSTSTEIPSAKFSAVKSALLSSLTTILPSTKLVPSGISSFIIAVPFAVPLFVTVIVYVSFSPMATISLSAVLSAVIIGLIIETFDAIFAFIVSASIDILFHSTM